MSGAAPRASAIALASLLAGCGDDDVAFAVQQSYVTAGEAPAGFAVWTFFPPAWEGDNDPALLLCARVQRFSGAAIDPGSLSGCPGCTHAYRLQIEELEHDCRGQEGSRPDLAGPGWLAVGPLPDGVRSPFADQALGWYASWEGERWSVVGSAFDEQLLAGGQPEGPPAWEEGRRLALWPAEALAL